MVVRMNLILSCFSKCAVERHTSSIVERMTNSPLNAEG
jgi:hypothetical protein